MTSPTREDAEALGLVVRDFLARWSTEADVRRTMAGEAGVDRDLWARMADLGLPGLVVPERLGGSGATPVELGAVFEELGAALYAGPFLATVGLAATALLEFGDDDASARHLPGIAAGTTTATLAWAGQRPAESGLVARRQGDGWVVDGTAPIVVDGATADLVLVAAGTPDGPGLFTVEADPVGLQRRALSTLDLTRKLAELRFDSVPVEPVGAPGSAGASLHRTGDLAALYLAAEQLGGVARVLATAVEYARTRVQFGRAIGSFQVIKHRCADMLIGVESARSVVESGLRTAAHRPGDLPVAAALARSVVSEVYTRAASDNVQIHGGIGFTWEHSAHLYLKRAKSSELLLGPPVRQRAALARHLGLTAATTGEAATGGTAVAVPSASDDPAGDDPAGVAAFLREHPVPDPADRAADRAFREARFDAGLAVVQYAPDRGGRGLDPSVQGHVEELFRAAGAADHTARNVVGLGMAMPTIHAHGTDEQKDRYLRSCFSGEDIWCQLFSEPGAGSDLAALATSAVRDGDAFVVNGQKVWTSLGHVARYGILLARTDPDVPKHKGLTYFLLDMRSPGVEVRPLRQMTGEAEFNEVYLTDVRLPASAVLGAVGDGWRVAMTTLANERQSIGAHVPPRGEGPIAQAVALYRRRLADGRGDAAMTERLMQLWTAAEAARLTNARAAARPGREPGPEGSVAKLQMAEINQAVYEYCMELSGTDGLLIDGYPETAPDEMAVHGGADVRRAYLRSRANSIEGGTSEVLRNIIGERVLGLPGEPRVDRDLPWRAVRRS
jgi:alkylation response protein AidB-like acyl-CoA dehydrogenase